MSDNDIKRLPRLTSILLQLQSRRMVTATTLAERFDVSVRTIYRDIRALEQSGVPIITEDGKGYSLMEDYRLPPVSFTEGEANALITAEQFVLKNRDASFIKEYTAAVAKIKAQLRQSTKDNTNLLSDRIAISQNRAYEITSDYLSTLQKALTNFQLTDISYRKAGAAEATARTVEPFALLGAQDAWLLAAWCRLRKEFRLFRLDRMESVKVREEKFAPHKLTLEEYLQMLKKESNP